MAYIGVVPVPESTQVRQTYTATAGQTSFATAGYTPNFIDVYLNGIKMVNGEDFEAINGSDVVLTIAAEENDILDIITYKTFNIQSGTVEGTWNADAHLNPQTIYDLTIPAGHNGALTGPVGVTGTLTIESGSNLVIADELTYLEDDNTWTGTNTYNELITGIGVKRALGFIPKHYSRNNRIRTKSVTERTKLHTPSDLIVNISGNGYAVNTSQELDVSVSAHWDTTTPTDYSVAANRAGKDFYIYAVQNILNIDYILSANPVAPDGYTTGNSRKIGGFHGLCADAGTLYPYENEGHDASNFQSAFVNPTGTSNGDIKHWLDGFIQGDLLPFSMWDLLHRPKTPEGRVFDPGSGKWVYIYLASWNGTSRQLESVNGGTIADGVSSPAFHQYRFQQVFSRQGEMLPDQGEFVSFSLGSPQGENIAGGSLPNTTGGHTATNGQRIVSLIGVEDATGVMWQWGREGGATNDVGSAYANAYDGNDKNVAGQHYNAPNRPRFGGDWDNSAKCGSRGSNWNAPALNLSSYVGARGVAEPYYTID